MSSKWFRSGKAIFGNFLRSAAVITFLGSLALAFAGPWGLPPAAITSLQLSLAVASLGLTFKSLTDDARREMRMLLGLSVNKNNKNSPYQRLAEKAFAELQRMLDELSRAEEHPQFTTEQDYLAYLSNYIREMATGQKLLALCSGKAWSSRGVKRYFDVNCEAARRGVCITRIFIQDGPALSPEQRKIMDEHVRAGAATLLITYKQLAQFAQDNQLEPDFGFVIFSREVVMHRGLTNSSKEGVIFKSTGLISIANKLFEGLQQIAEPYSFEQGMAA